MAQVNENPESTTLEVDTVKNTSEFQAVKSLLLQNTQRLRQLFNIQANLDDIVESIRLIENYEIIVEQQQLNESMLALRSNIKKRTYLSLGIGLISSSLFLLDNANEGNKGNLKYAGLAISLSIPLISLITLKSQLNKLAPVNPIDYSSLQNPDYPVTDNAKKFYLNELKIFLQILENLSAKYLQIYNLLESKILNAKNHESLNIIMGDFSVSQQHAGQFLYELEKFNYVLYYQNAQLMVNNSTWLKLSSFSDWIANEIDWWENNPTWLQTQISQAESMLNRTNIQNRQD